MLSRKNFPHVRLVACLLVSSVLHFAFIGHAFFGERHGSHLQRGAAHRSLALDARLSPLRIEHSGELVGGENVPAEEAVNQPVRNEWVPAVDSSEETLSEGIGLWGYQGEKYFSTDELSLKPQTSGELILPSRGEVFAAGKAILLLWIDFRGKVVHVEVERNDLSDDFIDQVEEAFNALPFVPGELNGRKVGTVMRVVVESAGE